MNLKNYKELKFAEDHGYCVSCVTQSLVILSREFDTPDTLMCMNCGMTCNQYAIQCLVSKTHQIPLVEMDWTKEGFTLKPKILYGKKNEGFYYQAKEVGNG